MGGSADLDPSTSPRRVILIRALIYGVVGVVMVAAAMWYPEFRYLYLLCAVLAVGRAARLIYAAKAASAGSAPAT